MSGKKRRQEAKQVRLRAISGGAILLAALAFFVVFGMPNIMQGFTPAVMSSAFISAGMFFMAGVVLRPIIGKNKKVLK